MAKPFFFSYAHNDRHPRLDAFFAELSLRVRGLTGTKEDGYRDEREIKPGMDWNDELVDQLVEANSMVCMYSASYFDSAACGAEMQVFLERRRLYSQKVPGKKAANIIPVLWQETQIPWALPELGPAKPRTLEGEGVWRLLDDPPKRGEFDAIAHEVAKRINEARWTPLPKLTQRPIFGAVESAFDPSVLPPADFDIPGAADGPKCMTLIYASAPAWNDWPFDKPDDPLLHIAASVAKSKELPAHSLAFDPQAGSMIARMISARQRNNRLLFLIHGASLASDAMRAVTREFDKQPQLHETCSILIGWRGEEKGNAKKLVEDAFPILSKRVSPLFHPEIDAPEKFALAASKSMDTLRMAVLNNLTGVEALPAVTEFAALPSVSGPGLHRSAQL